MAAVSDQISNVVATGGQSYTSFAAAAAAAAVKAAPGRLCRIVVITTGTAAVSLFDNASAASGTVLFTVPANAAVGTIYDIQIPATAGIFYAGGANTPGVNVMYT